MDWITQCFLPVRIHWINVIHRTTQYIGFGSTYPAMDSDNSRLVGANNSHTIGGVTHTTVNAISHGKSSLGVSHLDFGKPCYPAVTHYKGYRGERKCHAIHCRDNWLLHLGHQNTPPTYHVKCHGRFV